MNIEELGISKEELAERIAQIAVSGLDTDSEIEALIKERLDAKVAELADREVFPKVDSLVETICLQATNKWGEAKGGPLSFREYLVERAEAYLREEVDFEGKGRKESSYGWKGGQTRITYLVHRHLSFQIESAMKDALKMVNEALVGGLTETVKLKLEEITKAIKVTVGR